MIIRKNTSWTRALRPPPFLATECNIKEGVIGVRDEMESPDEIFRSGGTPGMRGIARVPEVHCVATRGNH